MNWPSHYADVYNELEEQQSNLNELMTMFHHLRFFTAGESHGRGLIGVLEGLPAGIRIDMAQIEADMKRRQIGYGRGPRMKIETDRVEILSGVRHGYTLGTPISILIENRDWVNWKDIMDPLIEPEDPNRRVIHHPRPGHADLAGGMKYGHRDLRNALERASARETAVRVALGSIARIFLRAFNIEIRGYIRRIGSVGMDDDRTWSPEEILAMDPMDILPCPDPKMREAMIKAIDRARNEGDTLGGIVEVIALNVPPGLGSYSSWDRRLDARLSAIMMAVPAVKGVHIGIGPQVASRPGSSIHDAIFYEPHRGYHRKTNRAGGIEGGVSNGEPIVVRIYKKPIPTLRKPLESVDILTRKPHKAVYERSDTTAVVPAVVIAETCMALVLADAVLEKFGGDHLRDTIQHFRYYLERLRTFPDWPENDR